MEPGSAELPCLRLSVFFTGPSKCPAHHDGSIMGTNMQIPCSGAGNIQLYIFPYNQAKSVASPYFDDWAENSLLVMGGISFSFAPGL